MTLRILVLILCILILFGCKSGSNHETSSVTIKKPGTIAETKLNTLPVDTPRYDQGEYALIVNIVQQNTSTYIVADYIQYLKGQAAIDAATRAHEADTLQTEDGKTHIGVQSDYFIANENKRLRRLELDKNCTFDLILNPDNPYRTPAINDNSLLSLKSIYNNDTPFLLTLNKEGMVIKIKEIHLPW